MISTLNSTLVESLGSISTHTHNMFATALAAIVTLLLVGLMIQKELARTSGRTGEWAQVLNLAIVPLLIAFLLIVAIRINDLRVYGS